MSDTNPAPSFPTQDEIREAVQPHIDRIKEAAQQFAQAEPVAKATEFTKTSRFRRMREEAVAWAPVVVIAGGVLLTARAAGASLRFNKDLLQLNKDLLHATYATNDNLLLVFNELQQQAFDAWDKEKTMARDIDFYKKNDIPFEVFPGVGVRPNDLSQLRPRTQ